MGGTHVRPWRTCTGTSQKPNTSGSTFAVDAAEIAWQQRFGQVGRIAVTRKGIRAVAWRWFP
jgi:hypothetical protein